MCYFFPSNLSAEELLSESRVLLHTERWHLCPLPVFQHTERAGEGNAEDEPLQDWHRSNIQSQGETAHIYCWFPRFFLCVIAGIWIEFNNNGLSPTAQSTQHSEVRNLPGPGEGAGVWYRYDRLWWCQKLLQVNVVYFADVLLFAVEWCHFILLHLLIHHILR